VASPRVERREEPPRREERALNGAELLSQFDEEFEKVFYR